MRSLSYAVCGALASLLAGCGSVSEDQAHFRNDVTRIGPKKIVAYSPDPAQARILSFHPDEPRKRACGWVVVRTGAAPVPFAIFVDGTEQPGTIIGASRMPGREGEQFAAKNSGWARELCRSWGLDSEAPAVGLAAVSPQPPLS